MDLMISDTEDGYQKKIVCLLLCVLIFYLSANILAIKYDHYLRKIEENAYVFRGDVDGKFALMKRLFGTSQPDIIFIGNSLTILHVDTHFFHANGINSFNFATTGYFIGQYPEMVNKAIKLKPKSIAFSITVDDFFKPSAYYFTHYDHTADITWRNFYFLVREITKQDLSLLINLGLSYLKNCSFFRAEGYSISRGFKEKYTRLQHGSKLMHMIIPHYRQRSRDQVSFDCDFDSLGNPKPSGCYNGDAVMLGKQKGDDFSNVREKIQLNNNALNLTLANIFNCLFDKMRQAGIKPYLILIPSYKEYLVDKSLLQQTIRAEIIDLSDIPFSKSYFVDNMHFNMQGRAVYSKVLVKKLNLHTIR